MAPAARAEPSAAGRYTRERYFRLVAEGVLQPDDGVELLVPGELRDYRRSRPTTALSVVEVSDSSLAQDRITKAAIYAAAASRKYWIVNLRNEQVEVFRGPDLRARRYRVMRIARHGERLTLRSLRGGSVAVDEVLPER